MIRRISDYADIALLEMIYSEVIYINQNSRYVIVKDDKYQIYDRKSRETGDEFARFNKYIICGKTIILYDRGKTLPNSIIEVIKPNGTKLRLIRHNIQIDTIDETIIYRYFDGTKNIIELVDSETYKKLYKSPITSAWIGEYFVTIFKNNTQFILNTNGTMQHFVSVYGRDLLVAFKTTANSQYILGQDSKGSCISINCCGIRKEIAKELYDQILTSCEGGEKIIWLKR